MNSIEQIFGVRIKIQPLANIAGLLLGIFTLTPNITCGAGTIEVVDDSGKTVSLEKPAARIVSLAPHITENLFSAGVGHLVVGVVSYSDHPDKAKKLLPVGSYDNFDTELILALQPDLVIAWKEGNQFHQVEALIKLGLTVYVNEPRRLEDVAADIVRFGILGGRGDEAKAVAQSYTDKLSGLRSGYSGLEKVSVFYQVWPNPLITVTNNQIIGNVIQLCGGRNIFAGINTPTPQISREAVLAGNPDVIIASGMDRARPDWLDDWSKWSFLKAAAYDNLFFIDPDIIQRHTIRILQGAQELCETLEAARQNIRQVGGSPS